MTDDAVQLERRIRFALSILGESNSHHEFEALCLGLARRRVTSNLLPTTGPVSGGGDQGRDAESHWSNIPRELPGTSCFEALASTERVVMACTIQRTKIPAKIRSDLASICGQGSAVSRVIYFTVTAVSTRKRHELIEEAARTHQVELDIWDGASLSHHLADHDLFYLAVQYLHLPSELAPPRPDNAAVLPDWYAEAQQRWRARAEPGRTLGDLVDLREPLRYATFHVEARSDLPEWIGYARALLDATLGDHTALRARYEIVVATLRGQETMRPADQLARDFFAAVTADTALTDAGILQDAVVLIEYGFGALVRRLTDVTSDELQGWQRLLEDKTDRLLSGGPPPHAAAHLLALRARLALHPDMAIDLRTVPEDLPTIAEVTTDVRRAVEAGEPVRTSPSGPPLVDIDTGMQTLARLGRHLEDAPLFPIEHTAALFDMLSPDLVDHPQYREVRDLLDAATDRVTGHAARGERAQTRGLALLTSDRILQALQEIHEAKANWWHGETLEGGLTMLLLCSRIYSELGLAIAAKQYALAAAAAAKSAPDPQLRRFIPRGIILAALYDHEAGDWLSATHLFRIGLWAQNAYLDEPYHPERHPYVWDMMANQATTMRAARAIRPGFVPLIHEITASAGIDTIIDDILAPTSGEPPVTEDACAGAADTRGVGRPFSDAGPTRRYTWTALDVGWEITCANDRFSVLAAERFTAAVQVLLAELARYDPLFLPGRLAVEVHADAATAPDQPADCEQTTDADTNRWTVRLTGADHLQPETAHTQLLGAAAQVLLSQSLLPDEAFMNLVEQAFASGLWHKLTAGRPYDDLADFLKPGDYQRMAALTDPAVGGVGPRNAQPKSPALHAKTGPGPGYSHDAALEAVRTRYSVMLPIVRHTLPRLLADPAFRRTASLLREQGWLDWHLLTAIANLTGSRRAQEQGLRPAPGDSAERRAQIIAVMTAPERPEDLQVPPEAFTKHAMRLHLQAAALSAACNHLGLIIRQNSIAPHALLSVLGNRYGYWTDDVDHRDLFAWHPD
ncbi:hypothetical protein ABZ896_03400 [Streptomyces sp. NPDC047072]|uniref:hypothetical protein n=1 Tax=Streptomyces sp. NPDC047072 TaxID=3154809 RepID=UPI0033EECC6A